MVVPQEKIIPLESCIFCEIVNNEDKCLYQVTE